MAKSRDAKIEGCDCRQCQRYTKIYESPINTDCYDAERQKGLKQISFFDDHGFFWTVPEGTGVYEYGLQKLKEQQAEEGKASELPCP